MAKITKSLSAKIDKQTGKAEILFRFVGSTTLILRAKSGIFIDPKTWSSAKSDLKSATFGREEVAIKKRLEKLCTTILDQFVETDRSQVTKEWLELVIDKFHFPQKYEAKKDVIVKQTFFEVFEEFLVARKLSETRHNNFMVLYRILRRYELYKGEKLDLDTATDKTIRSIIEFAENEHIYYDTPKYQRVLKKVPESRKPQPRGHNTISALSTKIRSFWGWCIKAKKTTNLPLIEVKEEIYGTPFYISTDERKQIERTNLSRHPRLAIQRDIFVFQCCIGCRISDFYMMSRQNLVDGAIQYVARKTKDENPVTVTVPLNETAKVILERYGDLCDGALLPFISKQKYNDAIKLIFRAARINRVVQVRNTHTGMSESKPLYEVASSHLARRTFVGNIYKQVKDPNLVGALSGHKEGSKAFARYRDIDNEIKKDLVSLLD